MDFADEVHDPVDDLSDELEAELDKLGPDEADLESSSWLKISYVKDKNKGAFVRVEQDKWKRTIPELLSADEREIGGILTEEVEADEAFFDKALSPHKNIIRKTVRAIRKVYWKACAQKFLVNRNVILHADSARSYRVKLPGVLRDAVAHKKRRVKTKGQVAVAEAYLRSRFEAQAS
ncbi:unnamed protein product [Symbiodinium natans]|uniref:Uncharacterized protein n=1 Tax=Symbiodinium natans TaxID=878477 RepID=A0A812MF75_9DINO|nr:unnamed protein product [Symbiodinium natans]